MPGFSLLVRNQSWEHTAPFRANPPIWARWQYSSAEWAAFDAWEWQHAKHEAWSACRPLCLLALVGLLVTAGVAVATGDPGWLGISLVPVWLFGAGGVLVWWAKYGPALRLHTTRLHATHTVEITPVSVTFGDALIPLVARQLVLRKVWIAADPFPVLRFHLTLYGRGDVHSEIRVPIPRAKIEEAYLLAVRFQTAVI